jgi:hypothetical protein
MVPMGQRRNKVRDRRMRPASQVASWVSFNPRSLSPAIWLDASDTATITESGGAVSQWDDKSGNGYHLTQATGTSQPSTGTRTLNNLNVVEFVTADWMKTSSEVAVSQPFFVFAVVQFDTSGRSFPYLLSGQNDTTVIITLLNADDLRMGASPTYPTISTNVGLDAPHLVGGLWHGASSVFRLDGSTSNQSTGTGALNLLAIGASGPSPATSGAWLDGFIAEIIVVGRALTAFEIATTQTYLAKKWGIAV